MLHDLSHRLFFNQESLNLRSRFSQKLPEPDTVDFFVERHNANIQVGNFEETAHAALTLNNLDITT